MALPLPYAPNIDVDAERLRSVRAEGARAPIDVGAPVAKAIETGMTMAAALEEGNRKRAAEMFAKEYLDKGNEGILKAYKEAGEPADFPIQAYLMPDGTPPDKAREAALLAIKDLTGARERAKTEDATKKYADLTTKGVLQEDGAYRPATEEELSAAEIEARGAEGVKSVAERRAAAAEGKRKAETAEKVANIRATATKTAATLRRALSETKDASIVAAITRENERLQDLEAEIDAARENPEMTAGAIRRLEDRINREAAAISARVSAYMTRVTDVSKIPETIRRPEAEGGPSAPTAPRPRAKNEKTGEIIEWDGSAWLPVKK